MKIRRTFVAMLALLLLSTGASLTQAQRQTYRGTHRVVRQLILRIENRTEIFRNAISGQNETRVYTNDATSVRNMVEDFDRSVVQLRENFDRRQSTAADAQAVLNRAAVVDRFLTDQRIRDGAVVRTWANVRTDLSQLARAYYLTWPTVAQTYPPNYPTPGSNNGANLLTGTYRLDPSKSDDPSQAANLATQSLPYAERTRLRDQLAARLESPDQLAIQLQGRSVTLASSRAPQITFSADGIERMETTSNGGTLRARATLTGDQLIVSSTGNRESEFNVTFNPIDNGRRLSVTRRVYGEGLARPVVVQSTYDRTSDVARFDINTGPQTYPGDNNYPGTDTEFIISNGESVVAILDNGLSTANARVGDRFTATVRQPTQYAGAIIEGHVSNVQRSGRLTGRSQLTLNFDTIRVRDGRSYRFAGILESVRNAVGDTVRIDNEGSVKDDNQTTKTAERAAIGTAVGAIIGAIAGGGKGAAIGAIVGAGGGAGSVYVQGRDDLILDRGSELVVRATGPR
jgi:YMGG-like Gly-zipper